MKYNNFNGVQVSALGLGGIPLMSGRTSEFLVKLKDVSYDDAIETIEYAIENGVNFIDTALDYGDSEEKIGIAIQGQRDRIFLASKSKALTYDSMMKDVELSLKRLGTDYIDLYQLHYVKDMYSYDLIMGGDGAYKALCLLKDAGVVRNIGVASHNTYVLSHGIESRCFDAVQLPYNLIETSGQEIIALANQYSLPTIIMKPYAGGSLVEVPRKLTGVVKDARELKKIALSYIYNQPISVVIPGCATVSEVKENLGIFSEIEHKLEIDHKKGEIIRNIIGQTFCRRCQYCEPCPQNIEISKVFRYLKYFEDYGLEEWARKQYCELDTLANQCIGCGECERKCPYKLHIIEVLANAHQKLGVL